MKLELYSQVKLNEESQYATESFQQEGFGHLPLGTVGEVIKVYDTGDYLVGFYVDTEYMSNIYFKKDLITVKPAKIYAENAEQSALDQFESAMSQDFAVKGALMPDAHKGYSLPIGGVVATKDAIVPAWVGYDIGCGMCAVKTNLKLEDIQDRDLRVEIQKEIFNRVPVGFARHKEELDWHREVHTATADILIHKTEARKQLGTLGGGNHFIEIGYDEEGCVWVTIHSGSRGLGWKIAEHYMKVAAGSDEPEEGHYALHPESREGKNYIMDLNFALDFALKNRKHMMNAVINVLGDVLAKDVVCKEGEACKRHISTLEFINRNHNHAEFKDGLWIHRKGATHAEKGMRGIIPGCSRDGVFIVTGKGNPASLCSSSHGAGRVLGRYKAKKVLDFEQYKKDMDTADVVGIVSKNTLDESAGAYKNIFEVMELQKDLVEVTHYIKPLISVKDGK